MLLFRCSVFLRVHILLTSTSVPEWRTVGSTGHPYISWNPLTDVIVSFLPEETINLPKITDSGLGLGQLLPGFKNAKLIFLSKSARPFQFFSAVLTTTEYIGLLLMAKLKPIRLQEHELGLIIRRKLIITLIAGTMRSKCTTRKVIFRWNFDPLVIGLSFWSLSQSRFQNMQVKISRVRATSST